MKVKHSIIHLWNWLDPIYYFSSRLHCLEEEGYKSYIRVRLTRYRGHTVRLTDGTVIYKNDLLIKIHLHNARLLKESLHIENETRKTLYIFKCVKSSLPMLASFLYKHPKMNEIKGIIGITTINKGYARLGFESFPISSLLYKWFKQLAHYPIFLLSTSKIGSAKGRTPQYLFMSKEVILSKYGAWSRH